MDIRDWLRSLGLERYEAAFCENEITEKVLPSLTAEDLKELGVNALGHRRILLDAIAALRADASATGPPPALTQDALKKLACLGNVADIATLALVHGKTEDAMHSALREAVRAGLVFREDRTYRFLHDRIQQAAYSLIPGEQRADLHLSIGRVGIATARKWGGAASRGRPTLSLGLARSCTLRQNRRFTSRENGYSPLVPK
jgi:hypothetical protein